MDRPAAPQRDPTDLRGSFSRIASTGYENAVISTAVGARQAVSRGFARAPSGSVGGRPLGPASTMPVLPFGQSAASTYFQSANDINSSVYAGADGSRRELQPMWETGSDASFSRASSFNAPSHSAQPSVGDGFDVDEVFGSSSQPFGAGSSVGVGLSWGQSHAPLFSTAVASSGTKRTFDDAPDAIGQEDEEEMATTDVEDEANDQPAPLAGARKLAPRRAMQKTQSMPASMFSSNF